MARTRSLKTPECMRIHTPNSLQKKKKKKSLQWLLELNRKHALSAFQFFCFPSFDLMTPQSRAVTFMTFSSPRDGAANTVLYWCHPQ